MQSLYGTDRGQHAESWKGRHDTVNLREKYTNKELCSAAQTQQRLRRSNIILLSEIKVLLLLLGKKVSVVASVSSIRSFFGKDKMLEAE